MPSFCANGRILSDVLVLAAEDSLLLDVEPESCVFVLGHLDKFIIADDVTLADETAEWTTRYLSRAPAPRPRSPRRRSRCRGRFRRGALGGTPRCEDEFHLVSPATGFRLAARCTHRPRDSPQPA
jgi:folate-binding Fe-S cluster repair protein YgfZ